MAKDRAYVGRLRDVGVTEIITWTGGDAIAALLSGIERVPGVGGQTAGAQPDILTRSRRPVAPERIFTLGA